MTIAIGAATIGSTVGALALGTPIFNEFVAKKLPFAIPIDRLFARLE